MNLLETTTCCELFCYIPLPFNKCGAALAHLVIRSRARVLNMFCRRCIAKGSLLSIEFADRIGQAARRRRSVDTLLQCCYGGSLKGQALLLKRKMVIN